jgi:AcrR family transcriptional regulator
VSIASPASQKSTHLQAGRTRQKLRTRQQILAAASALIAAGGRPTVAEAADAAEVSRRTAYRYFPTQVKLLTEAALDGLRVPMETLLGDAAAGATPGDVESRVMSLIDRMQALVISHEQLLRTMIHETVLEHGTPAEPGRGTRRIHWLETALMPARQRLGARAYKRLVSALALCGGIEALLVLRDIRGLTAREAISVSRWAARALVRQSFAEQPKER